MRGFLVLLVLIDSIHSMAISDCALASLEADTNCIYGSKRNACDEAICLKGPGQICGGSYGDCAENLQCSVEGRCEGCSFVTFWCWDHDTPGPGYPFDI